MSMLTVANIFILIAALLSLYYGRKVRKSCTQMNAAIEASLDGMAILDTNQKYTYVSASHALMYGYEDPSELIGASWTILYEEEERERFSHQVMTELAEKGSVQVESTGKKKDGSPFPQRVSLTKLSSGGLVCVVRDISEERLGESRVHNELVKTKEFLRLVLDTDPNLIFVKDADGYFRLANRAVAEVYGVDSALELIGKRDRDFNDSDAEIVHFRSDDLWVINNKKDLHIPEELITDANGNERWLQTVKTPIDINGEWHVLGVSTDISKQRQLHLQLLQSQKMEAIGMLAGGIAHDFNNLLTGILGYANLIQLSSDLDQAFELADSIEKIGVTGQELTSQLLGFAREGKNHNIPVDIHEIINETTEFLRRTVDPHIQIECRLDASCSVTKGDPSQLQQVIMNLAINACDAMSVRPSLSSRSSRLLIETSNKEEEHSQTPKLHIAVHDTGCGILVEHREKIFEPFFTTKEKGKGTGMGLAMVYGIVTNHGGTISVERSSESGSVFCVAFPTTNIQLAEKIAVTKIPMNGTGKVLLVDDNPAIQKVGHQLLSALGYEVCVAESGEQALVIYESNPDEIDLVLLDMMMPHMSGAECLEKLREMNPHLPAVLSSGHCDEIQLNNTLERFNVMFLSKPYTMTQLSEVVRHSMGLADSMALQPHTEDAQKKSVH